MITHIIMHVLVASSCMWDQMNASKQRHGLMCDCVRNKHCLLKPECCPARLVAVGCKNYDDPVVCQSWSFESAAAWNNPPAVGIHPQQLGHYACKHLRDG